MINSQLLKIICKIRHISQADLSRIAGVSRQAVTLWFAETKDQNKFIDLKLSHAMKISENLNLSLDTLSKSLPFFLDVNRLQELRTSLLWDRLYLSLDDFIVALIHFERQAVARFVQVFGIYDAAGTLGKRVWKDFPNYKKYIHPASLVINEKLCKIYLDQTKK